MKVSQLTADMKRENIIRKLHEKEFYQTEGKTYKELLHIWEMIRYTEIDVSKSENQWF